MGDSKQGNGQYNQWTLQESKMLLGLLVEDIKHDWRDASGAINKQTIEAKILPILNEKLGCQKTYKHYQNRMKWFKNQYQTFVDLLRYSSGFEWEVVSKKFTTDNEVWEDYFKSHPNMKNLRNGSFEDYEDLQIIIGNGTTVGKNALELGDSTDARTYGLEENENMFDDNNEVYETSYQTLSLSNYTSPPFLETNLEALIEKLLPRKKARTEYQTYDTPTETTTRVDLLEQVCVGMNSISTIASEIQGIYGLMKKREHDREKNNIWNSIKEIPNMDNHARFKALELVNKLGMKDAFVKMSLEERLAWIQYNME